MPMRRAIMTFWMSVVPPGWMATMPAREWASMWPSAAPYWGVVGQAGGAEDVQHGLGHAEAGGFSQIRRLGAFVGDVGAAVAHPVVAEVEQADDFGFDVDVDQAVAHVGVLGHGLAAALGGAAMVKEAVDQPVAADAAAGAVFQLQVGGGDLPTLIFAADQVKGGDADVVEIYRLLDPRTGAGLAAGNEQIHGLDGYARQVGRDHKPAEVFVALGVGVGDGDGPHIIAAVGAAYVDFLAVDDVVVAVAEGGGLDVRQVGAGFGLRQ